MINESKVKERAHAFAAVVSLGWALSLTTAMAQSPAASSNQTPAQTEAVVATNTIVVKQLQSTQAEQAELIQKLLGRLEQLEKTKSNEAQRADAAEKMHQAEVQKLQTRINELEGKVGSLESGKVLPEIAVTPKDGPTTQELEQKIRVMARNNEVAAEAAEAKAKETPKLSVGSGGFALSSADTNFVLKLRGLIQVDSRTFFGDSPYSEGNDGFLIRRARPIFEGTVFRDFDFLLTPDFAGSQATLVDAWLTYRYRPELQLRFGKMKGPVGLENLQSDTVGSFNERSMANDLVPVRNVGLQLGGDISGGVASYAVGIYNQAGDYRNPANSDFNDNKEVGGRIFVQPFKQSSVSGLQGLGLGVAGSYADLTFNANGLPNTTGGQPNNPLPGYVTAGQQQFFAYNPTTGTVQADGTHWRLSPQGYYYWGPFGLLGEYVISDQGVYNTATLARANLHNAAWQASAQWVLTGEPASFTGIVPKHSFDPRIGNWGAWQLVARISQLKIDSDAFPVFSDPNSSANEALALSVGLNWWLNKNIRVLTSFSYTTFDGGGTVNPAVPGTLVPPGTVTTQDEKVFFTRVQLAF
ncbi:MAG: porin [Verrucomicrobiota bacterium]